MWEVLDCLSKRVSYPRFGVLVSAQLEHSVRCEACVQSDSKSHARPSILCAPRLHRAYTPLVRPMHSAAQRMRGAFTAHAARLHYAGVACHPAVEAVSPRGELHAPRGAVPAARQHAAGVRTPGPCAAPAKCCGGVPLLPVPFCMHCGCNKYPNHASAALSAPSRRSPPSPRGFERRPRSETP